MVSFALTDDDYKFLVDCFDQMIIVSQSLTAHPMMFKLKSSERDQAFERLNRQIAFRDFLKRMECVPDEV